MKTINLFYDKYPYGFSFTLALLILVLLSLFILNSQVIERLSPINTIDLIAVSEVVPQKKKQTRLSEEATEQKKQSSEPQPLGSDSNPIDSSLNEKIQKPRLLSRLRQDHPKSGKNLGVSALVVAEITVLKSGKVGNVKILRVKLSKKFPMTLEAKLKKDYSNTAKRRLEKARFSVPIIERRPVAIRMVQRLRFKLE